jgi:hypothetical protein
VPQGTYLHVDEGVDERFRCAPGAGGWRYVGERSDGVRTDLVVDARWAQIRVEVVTPSAWVRGGVTGREVAWVRAGATEHAERASGFLGEAPAFMIAVARSLRLAEGGRTDVRLVDLRGPALPALTGVWRWRLVEITTYPTDLAPLPVEHFEVTDLATAQAAEVRVAGDVLLAAPGIELTALQSPPNLTRLGH